MTVKIITDSTADLPPEIVKELDINVVPLIVRFGPVSYRDGIDLTAEQFYEKLKNSRVFPVTSIPSLGAYMELYRKLDGETDEILVVSLSSALSGTLHVAQQARELAKCKSRIEIIDSRSGSIGEGFLAMTAARAALDGAKLDEVIDAVKANIPRVDIRATFDTLEYLRRGGRIGALQAFLGSLLKINPIATLKNGLVEPVERTRSRHRAIGRLVDFVREFKKIDELAVGDGASPEDAATLVDLLSEFYPKQKIYRTKMTPVIGAHTGPGLLLVAVLGDK